MNKYETVMAPSTLERPLTAALAETMDAVNELTKLVSNFYDQVLGPQPQAPTAVPDNAPFTFPQMIADLGRMRDEAFQARDRLQSIRNKV